MKHLTFALLFLIFTDCKSQVSFILNSTGCSGDSYTVTANSGTNTATGYTWSASPAGPLISIPNSSVTNIQFPSIGTFTISLQIQFTSGSGSATNTITISSTPTISITQSSFTTCITSNSPLYSKPVLLTANGAASYSWLPNIAPNGGPTGTARPTTSSCYTVMGYSAVCNGSATACVTVIPRFSISVTPTNTVICKNMNIDEFAVLLANNATPPAFGLPTSYSYSWTGDGILTTPFSYSVAVSPSATTVFTVEVLDSLNCISLPANTTVSVQSCTGIESAFSSVNKVIVYPNPLTDKIYFSGEFQTLKIVIRNSLNEIVKTATLSTQYELDILDLPTGFYLVNIQSGTRVSSFKVIKK